MKNGSGRSMDVEAAQFRANAGVLCSDDNERERVRGMSDLSDCPSTEWEFPSPAQTFHNTGGDLKSTLPPDFRGLLGGASSISHAPSTPMVSLEFKPAAAQQDVRTTAGTPPAKESFNCIQQHSSSSSFGS